MFLDLGYTLESYPESIFCGEMSLSVLTSGQLMIHSTHYYLDGRLPASLSPLSVSLLPETYNQKCPLLCCIFILSELKFDSTDGNRGYRSETKQILYSRSLGEAGGREYLPDGNLGGIHIHHVQMGESVKEEGPVINQFQEAEGIWSVWNIMH